ncbi:MAG: tRNA (adenosine(37)-N6)-dimethylallyltransferase MiaA [Gemmatimonadota bacterium]|nr:tRNA (adenosine(37)-N6)-dimethylallyltransferase MiaA [Gemmatimonadota bacterium]
MAGSSLRVVCGPTAAGKSAVAVWLAERHRAAIVSADSRQVYRGFDIGTAKPTAADRARVPHYGVDVLDPTARYSAAAWAADVERWLAEIAHAGRTPLIVGGTGFYLRALFGTMFDGPPLDDARRRDLGEFFGGFSVSELRRWCRMLDPERAHLGRTQLLRAVEVALLTGHRLSDLHRRHPRPARWRARYLLVDPGPALGARIEARVDAMLAAGWLDEVRALVETVPGAAPAWKASGYGALRVVAAGEESPARARERVIVETRQYAKRQRTWFRHQLAGSDVTPLDPSRPDWRDRAEAWWQGGEEA